MQFRHADDYPRDRYADPSLDADRNPHANSLSVGPIVHPPECQASAPFATISPDLALAQPTVTFEPNPEVSKDLQVDVFDELTKKVDAVYVYPDFNGKDWAEIKARYRAKIEAGLDTESFS